MRSRDPVAALLALALIVAPWSATVRAVVVDQAGAADAPIALTETDEGLVIHGSAGSERLELPPGAWVNRLEVTSSGWVAGGSRTSAGERELLLVVEDGSGAPRVHSIPGHDDPVHDDPEAPRPDTHSNTGPNNRRGAVPIVDAGRLIGVAWLEGRDVERLAVRAAQFNQREWEAPELVAPSVAGGQVALSAAVLSDGSWMLVWSRLEDGVSQTFWSRRGSGGGWTRPRPIDSANEHHEITPTIVASAAGALVARSRLEEGSYRVRVARFDGARWTELPIGLPPGSLDPVLLPAEVGGAWLLYQDALGAAWNLLEIEPGGRDGRNATVRASEGARIDSRPAISLEATGPVFEWYAEGRAPFRRLESTWRSAEDPIGEGEAP